MENLGLLMSTIRSTSSLGNEAVHCCTDGFASSREATAIKRPGLLVEQIVPSVLWKNS
jgi:hypothetical protein